MKFRHITTIVAIAFAALAAIAAVSCGKSKSTTAATPHGKVLVCYFSATGHTKAQAERIANQTGGDLLEIVPAQAYTNGDLDWTDSLSRSTIEMKDPASRPELGGTRPDLSKYTTIYIGYPNWWNTAPHIINSFIESNLAGLSGKNIVPFMTSGGGGIENSEADLHAAYPDLKWTKGRLLNDLSDEELIKWLGETH